MSNFWLWFLQAERRVHMQETLVEMATISAVLYFGTAVSGLVAIHLPVHPDMDTQLLNGLGMFALTMSLVFYFNIKRLPLSIAISHVFIGVPLIGLTVWAGHAPAAAQISIFYILSSIYCFHFLNIYASALIVILATMTFAWIGYSHDWEGWQSMTALLMGTSFTVGAVVELMVKRLHKLATIDALTGLYNRHTWDTVFEQELRFSVREGHPLTLMVINLNKFKHVNDTQGHLAGDRVLQKTAVAIKAVIRSSDIAARWGGDEFIVLLRNCAIDQAGLMEERLHQQLDGVIGMSIGLTTHKAGDTADGMLSRADQDMYVKKHAPVEKA